MNKTELLSLFQPDMELINQTMEQELAGLGNSVLHEVLRYGLFNGGKRIRPLLTVFAGRLCAFARVPEGMVEEDELTPPVNLYKLAMVFEFLHGASLLHDDVIDHAVKRRGKPSANTVWDNTHVILAGDFLHTRAMTLAGTIGGEHILTLVGQATAAMIEAEFLQMETVQSRDLSEENYFAVLRGKTAALIGSACEAGACYANGEASHQQALRRYGDALGLAFQVVDDLLDYLGDTARTGKTIGIDFIEGKMTLPLLHALRTAGDVESRPVMELLRQSPRERESRVDQVREFIEIHGGFDYARQGAETLVEAALDSLTVFPPCQARNILEGLARYVLTRKK